ncbi:MAG: hypothetical protein Q9167_003329 [Letrouitia subvulpina]
MQRDFLLPGGFGDIQGGHLQAVQASTLPTMKLLQLFRQTGLSVFHTREGHKPDLSDCPSSKLVRQAASPCSVHHTKVIGDDSAMGRLLVRGEYGHDIISELQPLPNEVVVDKPGKGAFWNTALMNRLKARAITHLIVCGVTTECCFATTIREANDRGFECCGITEATAGYNADFKCPTLEMISWSQGLFGFVATLQPLIDVLSPYGIFDDPIESTTPPQTPPPFDGNLEISALQVAYRAGLSPLTMLHSLFKKIEQYEKVDPSTWIYLEDRNVVTERAKILVIKWPERTRRPPLFGVPFSVKDSIDISGKPTTTACPPLTHVPSVSAPAFDVLLKQGAIFIGKTNLDQLAAGLTGCRSPYGIPRSVFNQEYISGGSSSGNCVSVGAGLVSFSLATDTAGSGRVPSGFNGVVGFKPTKGLVSASGITPACLSLDCIAFITKSVQDARTVWDTCVGYDENDRYAKVSTPIQRHINSIGHEAKKFKFGIPPAEVLSICAPVYKKKFYETIEKLQAIGGHLMPIDWSPFEKAGKLLYEGTFVLERLANLPDGWFDRNKDHLHPVTRTLFEKVIARQSTAVQAYRDLQAKALFTRQAEKVFSYNSAGVDILVVPTAPTHWTVEQVLADPISTNSTLGEFTHFGNVLDLCAVAVPAGTYDISELDPNSKNLGILPFSITFLGGSQMDAEVLEVARRFHEVF